ncbi:Nramp family divalent metal transporter [Streptomyces sp. TRM 70351]|uniref:Nramp family divalent metal transporter n=1 Tax=Streptomyces sp. TRM 70351 TaxID=3116552 RepID=UPI002E7B1F74|nr:Nramp family divalent metal transporter [Streptomyces sp. TRM 70351]MEE1927813.1 Nramp family divalent metal transporter [Streptomyces sp. TRM 70351]
MTEASDGGRLRPAPGPAGDGPGAGEGRGAGEGAGGGTGQGAGEGAGQRVRWRSVGPGLVVAATGIGAGDLVATLVAGSRFGYGLLWAVVVGCVIRIAFAEGTARWHLATGRTLFDGWRSIGTWTLYYFGFYAVLWGFVYGATAMSASALPLAALFPGVADLKVWGVATALLGLVFVWFNRYAVVERVLTVLVGTMFVVVVVLAVRVAPDAGAAFTGLVPRIPHGSLLYTLGLIGGVGGTITMAAYGYWVNAKGWDTPGWMRMMRLDNAVAYVTTGVFTIAMIIVGAELLHATQIVLEGSGSLLEVGDELERRFDAVTAKLFLIGFFAASFSSLVGVWHGVSLLFSDYVAHLRDGGAGGGSGPAGARAVASGVRERSPAFRGYLLWLTFPPIALLFLDRPFALVIAYGALGALFLPFLAGTLLWLLNREPVPARWRSGPLSNTMLGLAAALFVFLCVEQIRTLPW